VERFGFTFKASFISDERGSINQLTVPLEPSVAPIVFTRLPDATMIDRSFLEAFIGAYEVMGAVMAVEFKGDVLQISMPGQPAFELVPMAGSEFAFKGLSNFSVAFKRDGSGAVTEALVNQMGTVLQAKKR